MAANKMQFQYEVTANTSQAKKALADLDKALDRLNKQQKMDMGLSQELTEAADAARLLQRELNAAMDVKTGKLNVSELARGLAQAGTSVEQLSTKFLNAGTMGEAAFRGLAQSIVAAEVPMKRMNKTLSDAMTTLKNTVKWEISSTLVHGLEGAFSGAVSYAKNLNTSLTNIRIVTNQSIDDMVKFTKQANAAAKELSTTTKAYADASLIYYQQGDSQEMAAKKAAITIKASNASFETSAKEMSEYLTSVWNSYQVGADELERYVDIMANLGAKTATSLEEIATSMQKVAATANTVGVSMEQVSSIIATVSSVTRESAESIGTSYKTIFARIGDLKLGKVDEDGVGLGQVSSQLDAIGVKILDETGNLREMGDIIMDLGTKWQTMNQAQKTAVAQVVAGKRQYTQLMALFENWDMFQSNMNIAENSEGALQDMADIYAESWEAASARVQASMEGIFNKIINDQSIIKITNTIADLFGGIENVIDGLGGLGGVLTSVGSIATAVFKDKMIVGINNITRSVTDFKKSFDGKKGKDIFTSFFGESSALRDYKKNLTELQSELNERSGWDKQSAVDLMTYDSMKKIIEAKEQLLDMEHRLTTAEQQRYQASINSVNAGLDDIQSQNEAYQEQKKNIDKLINAQTNLEAQQQALQRQNPNATISSDKVRETMKNNIQGLSAEDFSSFNFSDIFKDIDQNSAELKDLLVRFKELNIVMGATTDASEGLKNIEENLKTNSVTKNVERLKNILENLKATIAEVGGNTSAIDNLLNTLSSGSIDAEKFEQVLGQAKTTINNFATAGTNAGNASKILSDKLGVAEGALREITEESTQASSMFRRLSAAMKNVSQQADDLLSGKGGPGSLGEKFTKFAQGATSAVSAFSTWSSVTKNWDGMSFTESLSSVAELVTDIATSGSLFGAAATAIGAGIGAILGAIEREIEETKERIKTINEDIVNQAEELNKSSEAADQAVKNFDDASKAWREGSLGQNEYLTIIDSVLEALDQEHLKVYALTGQYETLYEKIHMANQERMAGEVQKAQNLIITGYNTLDESLQGYSGKQSDSLWGRNGINVDQASDFAMAKLGFSKNDTGVRAWYWDGTQEDLPKLYSNWENLQTSQEKWAVKFRERNNGADFTALTAYMEQFTPVFTALETWSQMSANFALSNLNTKDLKPETVREEVLNTIYNSLGTTAEQATAHQKEMANEIANNWIKTLSEDLQLGFYNAYNKEVTNNTAKKTFETLAGKNKMNVSEDATLPSHWLSLNTDNNTFYNGMDPRIYADVQKMITYRGLANQAAKNDTSLIPSLLAQLNITDQNASEVGIHLKDGESLSEYLTNAGDNALTMILGGIQGYIDGVLFNTAWNLEEQYPDSGWTMDNWEQEWQETIYFLDQTWQNAIDTHIETLTNNSQLKANIDALSIDPRTGNPVLSGENFIKHFTDNLEQYANFYSQIKFDEKGNITDESYKLITNSAFAQLEENTAYVETMLAMIENGLFDFKSFFEILQTFQDEKNKLLQDAPIPEIDFDNTSSTDFTTLTKMGVEYTKWDETQMDQFRQMALNYGRNIGDWSLKTDAQKSQDVYDVAKLAFNKNYTTVPNQTTDPAGYASYLEALQKLNQYATEAMNAKKDELNADYANTEQIFNSLLSLDLSKPMDETIVSAEKFAEIMGMSIDDFNKKYTSASQKQLAFLKAQQKHSKKYADDLATQAQEWYDATGKELIEAGDMNAIQTWAILSQQVSEAQANAAESADNVNAAYASLNDEKIASIAAQWERANKEAEKQQQIAKILSSSVDTGIISNEEAAIVGITANEWAGYSTEVRAAKAATQSFMANISTIENLEKEKNAISGAIDYLNMYKDAWKDSILNDNAFEVALNSSFEAGDFGQGDEAIAKMKEFREAREEAIAQVGNGNADLVLSEMANILGIDKNELIDQINQVTAAGKDSIVEIYSSLSDELQSQAQEAVKRWEDAFKTISDAKKLLLEGGNLLEMLGDPQEFLTLLQNSKYNTPEEFFNAAKRGEITYEDLQKPVISEADLYGQYIKSPELVDLYSDAVSGVLDSDLNLSPFILSDVYKALGFTSIGNIQEPDGTVREYYQGEHGDLISADAVEQIFIDAVKPLLEFGKIDYEGKNAGEIAALMNMYAPNLLEVLKYSNLSTQEIAQQEENAIAVREAAKTDNLVINASGAIQVDGTTIEGSKTIGLTREDGKASSYEEYQQLQEAISRAQQAKYNGETWQSLNTKDKELLANYGINNFDQVDAAAINCANALAACADVAYQLAMASAKEQGYEYNATTGEYTKNGIAVTADQDPVVQATEEARLHRDEMQAAAQDVPYNTFEMHTESQDLDASEVDKYGDSLQKAALSADDLDDSLASNAEAADEVARVLLRAKRAVEEISESYDDWIKSAKDATRSQTETKKLAKEVKSTLNDLMDLQEDYFDLNDERDLGFLTDPETIDMMKDVAEGVEGAEDKMISSLTRFKGEALGLSDEIIDAWTLMGQELNDLPAGTEIEIGSDARVSPAFHSALNTAIASLYDANGQLAMGVNEANDILQSMGDGAGFDVEAVEAKHMIPGETYYTPITEMVPLGADGGSVPAIVGWKPVTSDSGEFNGVAYRVTNKKGSSGGRVSGGSSGGGGKGGGGGSKPQKKEKKPQKRYQDEIERYHKNNETLSRISEELDKIDKLKDRAYGNKHIDQLNAETDALKEQLEAQQALYDEAKKYQAADQIAVARYGAQFDADGTIVNYEEVMRNIVDEYNRAVDEYNNSAQEDGDKERLEAAEQRFEDAKKSIEDYEEAIATANQAMNDMLEAQNKISEIETEKITYKLELQIEMNERDLERFEYYQEKYEDSLKDQGIVYKSIYDSMLEYENNLAVIGEAMATLDQKRRDGLITDADYAETLQDLYDQIFENLGDLTEIQNELVDTYTNTLELAREEVEKTTDTIESANSALQSYLDIIALSGGETDYEKMAYFYEKMNENNLIKINIQRDHLNALLEEEDKFQEKIKSGQQLTDLEQKQYEALREEIQDTRDTLLSSTTEALEAIRTTYENTINGIAKDFEEFMVGAGDSIDHLQEQYGYFQEEQENYVSTAKELYEVSKLNRDIEGALGDATSKAAKEALKALQEKINKQSELNQLTEYDIEMNQLQYELLMARIKLEESQNAKDVVRLTRDENGNYAYRYTANQDKIDEAAQNYEDILQQINDTTAQRTSEIEGRMLETMAWAKEQMSAIAMDYTLTEEEKRDRLEELNNQFAAKMQYLHEQNGIATENLITNQEAIAEHYGVNLSEITSSTAGNVNTQIQSMIEKTQEYITKMNEALFGEGGADQSWKDYLEDIGIITSNAGTAYGDMVENTQEMGEMNHWSAEQAQEVIETLTDTLEPLETLTAAWDAHNSILEATISDYENLAQVIQGVLSAVGEIPNGGSATDVDGHAYAKGGMVDYTGLAWVDGSPSDPEMMLNPGDTQNILKATAMVKSLDSGFIGALVDSVKSAAQAMMHMFSGAAHAVTNIHPASTESLEQSVHITAEFPNVQDHNEIEEALLGLVNRSAQFANQKK